MYQGWISAAFLIYSAFFYFRLPLFKIQNSSALNVSVPFRLPLLALFSSFLMFHLSLFKICFSTP
ncbi:unnamed protein product [Meloidogyne enterolobii]|uniref:Uncharacterized protein n=1 Tax=Meloidogyne enterolobii TaxID=390850 RepID=A0ACB0XZD6_MELEN